MKSLNLRHSGSLWMIGIAAAVMIASQVPAAAGSPSGGRSLVLDLPGGHVVVDLLPQDTEFLLQPVSGDKVPYYTEANAGRIAAELERAGQMDRLPDVLLGTAMQRAGSNGALSGPQGRGEATSPHGSCDLVLHARGSTVHVTMEDGPAGYLLHPVTGERLVRFSVESGRRVAGALSAAGFDSAFIARTLVSLTSSRPEPGHPRPVERTKPLPEPIPEPPCGQCANGATLCQEVCCGAGAGCTQCTVC